MQSAVLLGTTIQNAVPIAFTIQNAIAFAFVLQCRMPQLLLFTTMKYTIPIDFVLQCRMPHLVSLYYYAESCTYCFCTIMQNAILLQYYNAECRTYCVCTGMPYLLLLYYNAECRFDFVLQCRMPYYFCTTMQNAVLTLYYNAECRCAFVLQYLMQISKFFLVFKNSFCLSAVLLFKILVRKFYEYFLTQLLLLRRGVG